MCGWGGGEGGGLVETSNDRWPTSAALSRLPPRVCLAGHWCSGALTRPLPACTAATHSSAPPLPLQTWTRPQSTLGSWAANLRRQKKAPTARAAAAAAARAAPTTRLRTHGRCCCCRAAAVAAKAGNGCGATRGDLTLLCCCRAVQLHRPSPNCLLNCLLLAPMCLLYALPCSLLPFWLQPSACLAGPSFATLEP